MGGAVVLLNPPTVPRMPLLSPVLRGRDSALFGKLLSRSLAHTRHQNKSPMGETVHTGVTQVWEASPLCPRLRLCIPCAHQGYKASNRLQGRPGDSVQGMADLTPIPCICHRR